jgi:dihydroflavonol-4-reductase
VYYDASRVRVCVTGGNGFIGSVVVRLLVVAGHEVVCLLRAAANISRLAGVAYQRVEGDVRDAAAMRAAADGADAVVHLACPSSWDQIDSPLMREVAVGGTRNVLAAAGAARVVYVSSAVAIGASDDARPLDENAAYNLAGVRGLNYAQCKHEAEGLCREASARGHQVVIVNPAEVYGPNDLALVTAGNLVNFVRSRPVLVCRGGTSIAHVDDVAFGVVRALERGRPGERYILGGDNLTLRQLATLTLELADRRGKVRVLPNGLIRAIARTGSALHLPLPFNPKVIPYATRYFFVDAAKARRELGITFRPPRETLAPTLAWLRAAGHLAPS